MEVTWQAQPRRKGVRVNGAPVDRLAEAVGTWLVVAFIPEDVTLAGGPAAARRRYLDEVRHLSPAQVTLFTYLTATPAALGFVVGGKIADVHGRRRLLGFGLPLSTALAVLSFSVGGAGLWLGAFGTGFIGGIAYPAFAVYRTELFPTGNRSRAAGLITAGQETTIGTCVPRWFVDPLPP